MSKTNNSQFLCPLPEPNATLQSASKKDGFHKTTNKIYYNKEVTITPEELLDETINTSSEQFNKLNLEITANGKELLYWHAEPEEVKPIPDASEAALLPQEIKTTEQLYLTGLHLEQYRHATYNPVDYYEEALRRDPIDVRSNNALGLWYIRKGRFHKAEQYLLTAVKTLHGQTLFSERPHAEHLPSNTFRTLAACRYRQQKNEFVPAAKPC